MVPAGPNGIKLEMFIFDSFPYDERMVALAVSIFSSRIFISLIPGRS